MPTPEASLVVIACPHCGTRYQLAYEAIGAKGRSVACAHCGESWDARADPPSRAVPTPPDAKLADLAEAELDEKFRSEERRDREKRAARAKLAEPTDPAAAAHQRTLDEIKAAVAVRAEKPSAKDHKRQQHEFSQRQKSLYSNLPRARARRLIRLAALGALIVVFGGGLLFRNAIVEQFPQLAAGYAALGLKVNVVGLEFSDLSTVKSLQDGDEVLVVDGKINNVAGHQVSVPPVIVTLTDRAGAPLYGWSMTPRATELEAGEVVALETRLTAPPAAATGVRLSFAEGISAKPVAPPALAGMDDSTRGEDDTKATASSGGP